MKLLDIGELAKKAGVSASTLRYYEEVGLIQSVARHGLRRQFEPRALMQLSLITLGKTAGFSLEEMRGMFAPDGMPELSRMTLHGKAEELDAQIRKLTTLRNALRHVAECKAQSHMDCPKFQRLLRVASTGRRQKSKVGAVPEGAGTAFSCDTVTSFPRGGG
ncbi:MULTISPECIES: helix-turn-helix domain-containing protein [unclassified Rhizobium]|uniref:helix-turn-helix domain-containing protein n=1 Tax=unclassified Rhizobium TaxID=2613769 RepID=UPI0009E86520|nr:MULTISPECIES: helix-turn-helix domain-containing protein [unclassified Rhizobium]